MLQKTNNPGCQCCCQACVNGVVPAAGFQIEIAGMANGTCTNCTALNGTFVLTVTQVCTEVSGEDITNYGLTLGFKACTPTAFGNAAFGMTIKWEASTATRTIRIGASQQLSGGIGGVQTFMLFELIEVGASGPWVCTEFDELDIPYLSDSVYCDGDAAPATCLLSAA